MAFQARPGTISTSTPHVWFVDDRLSCKFCLPTSNGLRRKAPSALLFIFRSVPCTLLERSRIFDLDPNLCLVQSTKPLCYRATIFSYMPKCVNVQLPRYPDAIAFYITGLHHCPPDLASDCIRRTVLSCCDYRDRMPFALVLENHRMGTLDLRCGKSEQDRYCQWIVQWGTGLNVEIFVVAGSGEL